MPPIHGTCKSVVVSSDTAAVTGKGYLYAIIVSGAAGAVVVYDNTAASGNAIWHLQGMGMYRKKVPLPFTKGVFIDLSAAQVVTVIYGDAA